MNTLHKKRDNNNNYNNMTVIWHKIQTLAHLTAFLLVDFSVSAAGLDPGLGPPFLVSRLLKKFANTCSPPPPPEDTVVEPSGLLDS